MIDSTFVKGLGEDLKKKKHNLVTTGFVKSLSETYDKWKQPEAEESLLEKMGLGIFTPESYYKKMKGMVDIISDYGKKAVEEKLREDTEFMKDYVTAYTPTLPTEERQKAGQRIKKRYYNTVENMYMAQAVGRLGRLIWGKAKQVITGARKKMFKRVFSRKEVLDSVDELQSYYVSVEGRIPDDALTRAWKTHTDVLRWADGKYTLKGKAEVWVKKLPRPYEEIPAKVTPTPTPKPGVPAEVIRKPVDLQKLLIEGKKPTPSIPIAKSLKPTVKESIVSEKPPGAIIKTPEVGEKPLVEELYPKPKTDIMTGKPLPVVKPTPTEPIDIKEPEEIPEITEFLKDMEDIGQPGQIRLTPFVDGYKKLHRIIFTHGEAQLEDKILYKKLMSRFHRSSAAVEKAIWKVDKAREKIVITPEEDTQMAFAYEDKKYIANLQHKEFYKKLYELNQQVERAKLKLGIIKKRFQDRMIEDNDGVIKDLIEEQKIIEPTSQKAVVISEQIKALQAENERFKNMRYLYHNAIVDRIIENRIEGLEGEERRIFIDKLVRYSFKYGRRVGKVTLKDYVDVGLLNPEDVRLTKLTIENLDSYYCKAAIQSLHNLAIERGLIKPYSQRLINEGWATPREAGITAYELKGKLLHPLYANALGEIRQMKLARGGKLRQLFGAVKVAQFIKPSILLFYDMVQAIIRGMYSINPATMTKLYAEATHVVMSKSARYHQLNSLGLFQHPMEMPRAAREEMIEMTMRQMGTNMPGAVKLLEKITNMSWKKWHKNPFSVFMSPIRTLANVAWTGDKIIRTTSVLALEKMGYPTAEAVQRAAKGHGAYSMLSPKYKKFMGWVAFVHSFRVLMPIEMGKILLEPVMESVKAAKSGKPIPKHRLESMAKAIIGTLIIPAGIELYMKMRGFKRDKLGWKWKKEIIDPDTGEKREVVVALNYILNMPLKWYHRATYYNPIRTTPRALQALYNLLKWEVHPIYRIFDDIVINKRSIGGETEQVYNPTGTEPEKAWQIITYIMQQSFRHIGVVSRAFITGEMTTKEKKIQDKIMDKAFNSIEKLFLGRASPLGVGYSYVRENKQEMGRMWLSILNNEFKSKMTQLHLKYDPSPERNKMIQEYIEWRERCIGWIERTYDYKIPTILKARIEGIGTIPTAGIKKEKKAPVTADFVRQLHDSLVGAELR